MLGLVVGAVMERDEYVRLEWDGCLCSHCGIDLLAGVEEVQDADLVAEGNSTDCKGHRDTDPSLGTP